LAAECGPKNELETGRSIMAEVLTVQRRQDQGKHAAKRLRKAGRVPAVLYGHGQENVHLAVPVEQVDAALRHHSRVVQLSGEINEQALIRELQWDVYGLKVLHIDFARVSSDETVRVTVAVELRGEAPGVREGGTIEHYLHEVEIECLVATIPEKLLVSVNQLNVGGALKVSDLDLPPNTKLLADPEAIVVQCVERAALEEELQPAAAAAGEPEVIGRKPSEEEEAEE
jgi:large subunit ribosomal protein L25